MNFKLLIHWQRNALKNTLLRLLVYTINAIIFFWLLLIFAWGAFQLVVPETFHCCMLLVGLFPALNAVMHQMRIRSLLPHGCCPVHNVCWSRVTSPTFWFQLTPPAPLGFSVTASDHQCCSGILMQVLTDSASDCKWWGPLHCMWLGQPLLPRPHSNTLGSSCHELPWPIHPVSIDTAWWLPALNATAATNT